ncbi:MAG: preprotein translocase subunit SecG [Gammaproteobacteria bacterium]|nr:preprotein translocase subunit SecG [Gammaproteobacteria bacterium]MCD8543200.1 preprotein translocase subunit SecG [Gammaproteobacteria bacterium]
MGIQIILIFHVFMAVCLIGLVLIQQGKGATAGVAFGSGASGTVFGSRGSRGFLYKLTGFFAVAFFVTSITLTYFASHSAKDAAEEADIPGLTAPVTQVHLADPGNGSIKPEI